MRVHDTALSVETRELRADGECGDSIVMDGVTFHLGRMSEDLGWQSMNRVGATYGSGKMATAYNDGFGDALDSRTSRRGETYRVEHGVHVEPTWTKHDRVSGDGALVEDPFEVPID